MPRVKSVPVAKRPLDDTLDSIIDDSEPEILFQSVVQQEVHLVPKNAKKRRVSKKKVYEFAVDQTFEDFLSDANFYLTINLFTRETHP